MPSLDTSLVDKELVRISKTSQSVKKLLRSTLEKIEKSPSAFPLLEEVPIDLAEFENLIAIRKAKITNQRHDFRLIFAHWRFEADDHVDLLMAFPRKADYRIDWIWLKRTLAGAK